jgi:hypothetical protein
VTEIHELDQNIRIAGRDTTIRREVQSGTSIYSFKLGTKTHSGDRTDGYFINVYKSPDDFEVFYVSKESFDWIQSRGVETE